MWTVTLLFVAFFTGPREITLDRPVPQLLTGKKFRDLIKKPEPGTKKASMVGLRDIVRILSRQWPVAIVIDRRVDPSRQIEIHVANNSLLEILQKIAKSCSAEATVVDDFIYIAPKNAAKQLEKVAKARTVEMRKLPRAERRKLIGRRTLHWNDLDEPRTILLKIAETYNLNVESAETIPHDLWAGSTVPNAGLIDQLSLILIQYDLTFQWEANGKSIKIVKIGPTQ